MRVIIMGCGRVGAELASLLSAQEHQVTLLDIDPDSFEKLPKGFPGETRLGDGTDAQALMEAGVEQADAFIALTEVDNRNILSAQMAKHLYGVPRVLCRIYDPVRSELYESLGLETFSPTRMVAQILKGKLEG